MEQVDQAERWVNEYCNRPNDPFTGTIPDGVVYATLHMAKFFMDKHQLDDGHIKEMPNKLSDIEAICKIALASHKKSITYSSSASDFHLPSLEG